MTDTCPVHKHRLVLRDMKGRTQEQSWCGQWFECPHPNCQAITILIPSTALCTELVRQRKSQKSLPFAG